MKRSSLIDTSRKPWIDALRGLAMLLVVYGHCVPWMTNFFVYTSPFKMPLFFAITGYVFNSEIGGDIFFKNMFRKVILPWMVLGLSPILFYIPFNGIVFFFEYFLKLVSGQTLWFMPCFVIAYILHYCLRRFVKNDLSTILISLLCFVAGIALSKYDVLNYSMINRAIAVQPFFLIGTFFRRFEKTLVRIKWIYIFLAALIYLGLCFWGTIAFSGETIDVHQNLYFNMPFCLLIIVLSCGILFTAASKVNFSSFVMSLLGQNTLVIYCWHFYAFAVLSVGVSIFGIVFPVNGFTAIIYLIWALILCSLFACLLNKYVPEIVGKRRKIRV